MAPRKSLYPTIAPKDPTSLIPSPRQTITERIAAATQVQNNSANLSQSLSASSAPLARPQRLAPLPPPKIAITAIASVAQAKELVLDVPQQLTKYLDAVLDAFPGYRGVMLDPLSREVAAILRRTKGAVEEMGVELLNVYQNRNL